MCGETGHVMTGSAVNQPLTENMVCALCIPHPLVEVIAVFIL